MCICSITPRIDYSQGNQWDSELKTMDDLHKPALDGIGYQDSINSERAWWAGYYGGEPNKKDGGGTPPFFLFGTYRLFLISLGYKHILFSESFNYCTSSRQFHSGC